MIIRFVTAAALSASVLLTPFHAQAQVHELVKACKRSLTMVIGCIIIERGIEKGVEVGLDSLIGVAFGKTNNIKGNRRTLTPNEVVDIKANGIEWSQLKDFLLSRFKSGTPVDDAQARKVIAASCNANYSPVCAQLGFPGPRIPFADCSTIKVAKDCGNKINCSWKGSLCVRSSGTRDLLKQ